MSTLKETYRDDPDSRLANMELVLDESETNMVNGINTLVDTIITPFIDNEDWSRIAQWNFDSIYGSFYRHNEMCNASLDKTKELTREAVRDDVGTEITKGKLASLIFRNKVQSLNCRRSQLIVDTLEKKYQKIFGKSYIPVAKRGSVTDKIYVNQAEKDMMLTELKKLVS
jgi:hypothetical protein